jgi:hypothetical protein
MPSQRKSQRSGRHRSFCLFSILIVLISAGVLQADPGTLSDQTIQQITKSVADIRGLAVRKKIPVRQMSRKELSEYIRKELKQDLSPARARKFERTLQAFGLFPRDKQLMQTLEDLLVRSIAGFYEPDTDKLFLIQEPENGNGTQGFNPFGKSLKQLGIKPQELHASHELTHALQDQHFNLGTLPFRDDDNDDRVMAQKALIEGEATYVMYEYLLQKQGLSFDKVMSNFKPMVERLLFSDTPVYAGADAPLFVQKMLIFPYMAGLLFVRDGFSSNEDGKWTNLNRAYVDMPTSTEQILHPESYFDDRDPPEWPDLPEMKGMKEGGYSFLQENRFGEYGIHLLLLKHLEGKREQIRQARTGWDGDVYRTYANASGDRFRYLWMTTWDSEADAREFASLYRVVLKKKLDEPTSMNRSGRQLFVDRDGRLSFVHRMGEDVLIGEGVPLNGAGSTIRRAWQNTSWSSPETAGN